MKKQFAAILTAVLTLSIAACGNGKTSSTSSFAQNAASAASSSGEQAASGSASGKEGLATNREGDGWSISTAGDQLTLAVSANATTGYSWVVDDAGSDMFQITDQNYVEDDHPEGLDGYGGTEYFYITVTASGSGKMTFEYKQDWEGGESAGTYDLDVTAVDENGGVVITDADFTSLS